MNLDPDKPMLLQTRIIESILNQLRAFTGEGIIHVNVGVVDSC